MILVGFRHWEKYNLSSWKYIERRFERCKRGKFNFSDFQNTSFAENTKNEKIIFQNSEPQKNGIFERRQKRYLKKK